MIPSSFFPFFIHYNVVRCVRKEWDGAQAVLEAILSNLLRKKKQTAHQQTLKEIQDYLEEETRREIESLHEDWDEATRNEKRSRTLFSQNTLSKQAEEVGREYDEVRSALGSTQNVVEFTLAVLQNAKAATKTISPNPDESPVYEVDFQPVNPQLREYCDTVMAWQHGKERKCRFRFELPVEEGVVYISRTHPLVETLADYVLNTALDASSVAENTKELVRPIASRCGLIYTKAVKRRTTLLLLRYRFHLVTHIRGREHRVLAEDVQVVGFRGAPEDAVWLDAVEVDEILLSGLSTQNILTQTAKNRVQEVLDAYAGLEPKLNDYATVRAGELRDAHQRVRHLTASAAGTKTGTVEVHPELPPDLLGVYVYLPEAQNHS